MANYKLMPAKAIPQMEQAAEKYWNERRFKGLSDDPRTWAGVYQALLSEAPMVNIVATKNEQGQIVSVTLQDEDHRILEVIAEADVQGELIGYIRRSALELMKNDELGVRANITKEPRYQDCVALYTAPQPAEQQPVPDVAGLVEALNILRDVRDWDSAKWESALPRIDAILAAHTM